MSGAAGSHGFLGWAKGSATRSGVGVLGCLSGGRPETTPGYLMRPLRGRGWAAGFDVGEFGRRLF